MSQRSVPDGRRESHPPPWLPAWFTDVVDILELHRTLAATAAIVAAVLGVLLALVAPGILPREPLVGAAVGFAAAVLGVVAAVVADAGDPVIRGARHVTPTGATIVASGPDPLPDLAAWAGMVADEVPHVRIAVVAAGADDAHAGGIADAIGAQLARGGRRVLVVDLSRPGSGIGLLDVAAGRAKLVTAVDFDPDLRLARLAAGGDQLEALTALPRIGARLHGDVDVVLVALPGLRHPGSPLAATATDRSLLLAVAGSSTRVDVLAGIAVLDAARSPADLAVVVGPPLAASAWAPAPPAIGVEPPVGVGTAEPAVEGPEADEREREPAVHEPEAQLAFDAPERDIEEPAPTAEEPAAAEEPQPVEEPEPVEEPQPDVQPEIPEPEEPEEPDVPEPPEPEEPEVPPEVPEPWEPDGPDVPPEVPEPWHPEEPEIPPERSERFAPEDRAAPEGREPVQPWEREIPTDAPAGGRLEQPREEAPTDAAEDRPEVYEQLRLAAAIAALEAELDALDEQP